jgi:hypothetical protein
MAKNVSFWKFWSERKRCPLSSENVFSCEKIFSLRHWRAILSGVLYLMNSWMRACKNLKKGERGKAAIILFS